MPLSCDSSYLVSHLYKCVHICANNPFPRGCRHCMQSSLIIVSADRALSPPPSCKIHPCNLREPHCPVFYIIVASKRDLLAQCRAQIL